MKKIILPILVLGLMMVAMPTMAAEYYIDAAAGDNSNDGSVNEPWKTLEMINYNISGGDTVYLSGEFTVEYIRGFGNKEGTADNYTHLTSVDISNPAIINSTSSDDAILTLGSNYQKISYLEIVGPEEITDEAIGVRVDAGVENTVLEGCIIHGFAYGVSANAVTDNTITGNMIYNNTDGMQVEEGSLVTNNYIYNNSDGINVRSGGSAEIYNNTLYNNSDIGLTATSPTSVIVKNNIFSDHAGMGGAIVTSVTDNLESDYNLFYNNVSIGTVITSMSPLAATVYETLAEWQALGYDANSIEGDPVFVSTTSGSEDLHLQAASPAIDAGIILTTVTDDYDGDIRPQGDAYDIGADEYVEPEEEITAPNKPKFKKVTKKNGIVLKRKGAQVDYFKARIIKKKAKTKVFVIKRFTTKKKAFTNKQKKKLKKSKSYTCKVKACNDAGCSAWRSKSFTVSK